MDELLIRLEQFLAGDDEVLWLVHPLVYLDDDWDRFYLEFDACVADFLATRLRYYDDDQGWPHWKSLQKPGGGIPAEDQLLAMSMSIVRFSRAAASAVLNGVAEGWTGHVEVLIPTLVRSANLVIEDIGGGGMLCPPGRRARWYDARTIREKLVPEFVRGKLHYPSDTQDGPLADGRVRRIPPSFSPKILFASPVGRATEHLLDDMLSCFSSEKIDVLLLAYDGMEREWPENSKLVRDTGSKWQLAMRHLQPDAVSKYDYVFYWDDDIRPNAFDPIRFVRIMEVNSLQMAQPAILSPFGLSHAITAPRSTPPPRFFDRSGSSYRITGRLTNFVEIMVPVFSRNGWRRFFDYLTEDNLSGWGYDYAPVGAKGIVDTLPVTHTRKVQSMVKTSVEQRDRLLRDQGLFSFATVDHGWLFEEADE